MQLLLASMYSFLKEHNANDELGVSNKQLLTNTSLMNEMLEIGFNEIRAAFKGVSIGKEKAWRNAIKLHYGVSAKVQPDREKYKKGNFLGQCIKGTAKLDEYEKFYRYWIENGTTSLAKYLGMTQSEFERFKEAGESALIDILIDKAVRQRKRRQNNESSP